MKLKFYLGFLTIILLTIGCIIPIAYVNDQVISLFPVWHNFDFADGIWQWKDIAFFSLTLGILIILSVYFITTKKYKGFIAPGVLSIFICLVIFAALIQMKVKINGMENFTFTFGWGLFVLLFGGIISIITSSIFLKNR